MWWSTRCIRSDPGWISGREPVVQPGSGRARATSRHARTPAAPEPKDLEAVAQGLRRGGGAGRLPAPRRSARAAGLRRDAAQVGALSKPRQTPINGPSLIHSQPVNAKRVSPRLANACSWMELNMARLNSRTTSADESADSVLPAFDESSSIVNAALGEIG